MKKLIFLFAMVFAVSMAMAQSNESTISVSGDDNEAYVDQIGLSNVNILTQTRDNYYDLNQTGDENYSKLSQVLYGGNTAYVDQEGNRNRLNGRLQGTRNFLDLFQNGNDNVARVYQDMSDHVANIDQVGNNNNAEIDQDAPSSTIDIDLNGNNNETYVNQRRSTATNINEAIVNVTGSFNGDATYGDVRMEIRQDGEGNYASTLISGDYNDADISQTGDFNQAWANVIGGMNVVDVMQTGDSNMSTNTVGGDSNAITITQGPTP